MTTPRSACFVCAALLTAAVFLAGCDTLTTLETPEQAAREASGAFVLPPAGTTPVPGKATATHRSVVADTTAPAPLTDAERAALFETLTRLQALFGSRYVVFISQRLPDGSYRYRYRTLHPPRKLLERTGERSVFYVYRLMHHTGAPDRRLLAAVVPEVPGIEQRMRRWVSLSQDRAANSRPSRRTAVPPEPGGWASPSIPAKPADVPPCGTSEIVYFDPVSESYWYEGVEVCDSGGGEGGQEDPLEDPAWPPEENPFGCEDPFFGCDQFGGDGAEDEPGSGEHEDPPCDPQEITCEAALPWVKAMRIGRKVRDAARRGEDLLDATTWKRLAQDEWDELLSCGIDALEATSGDPVALIRVLDCAANLLLGFGFFDMLQRLKLADRLGLSWYDEVVDWIIRSSFFDDLASRFIGTGHAWTKHGHKYPPGVVDTQDEFVDLIQNIIRNPDEVKTFRTDIQKKAFWDNDTETIVIFDPANPDLGTAFRPDISRFNPRKTYFDQLGE